MPARRLDQVNKNKPDRNVWEDYFLQHLRKPTGVRLEVGGKKSEFDGVFFFCGTLAPPKATRAVR